MVSLAKALLAFQTDAPAMPQRFWAKIEPTTNDSSCWLWRGARNSCGYGSYWHAKRLQLAHRVAYEAASGSLIPPTMTLDHLCRVRNCCNPDHLEIVSQAENVRRARKSACKRGHVFDATNTIVHRNGRRQCRACKLLLDASYRARRRAAA